jgi:hypothetical protein
MRKYLLFLFVFSFLIVSCSKDKSSQAEIDTGLIGVTDSDFVTLPIQATTFDVNLTFISMTSSQKDKMEAAAEIIRLVVGTDEFKNRVLNHTYNGQKTFVDNGGFTNAQIYQIILNGAEKLIPAHNNTIDAEVELYYAATNVVGYTYPSTNRIWVNTKYFNTYTAAGVAHNLFHEWMHKLGFNHSSAWTESRDYSVPYAIGDLVGEIGRDFL